MQPHEIDTFPVTQSICSYYFISHTILRQEIFYISSKDSKKEKKSLDNAAWQFATAITESSGKTEICTKNNIVQPGPLAICYLEKKRKKNICFSNSHKPRKTKQTVQPSSLTAGFVSPHLFLYIYIYKSQDPSKLIFLHLPAGVNPSPRQYLLEQS